MAELAQLPRDRRAHDSGSENTDPHETQSTIGLVVEIREARAGEGPILAGVQERASVAALAHIFPPEQYPYPRDAVHDRWIAAVAEPETRALIAVTDDEPVGAACITAGWLEGLYVVPGRWGTGLANRAPQPCARARARSRLAVLQALGTRGQHPRTPVLRAARLVLERRDARRRVSAESARHRLHARLLDWLHDESALRPEPDGVAPRRQRVERCREPRLRRLVPPANRRHRCGAQHPGRRGRDPAPISSGSGSSGTRGRCARVSARMVYREAADRDRQRPLRQDHAPPRGRNGPRTSWPASSTTSSSGSRTSSAGTTTGRTSSSIAT